jgi:hypothetical protein
VFKKQASNNYVSIAFLIQESTFKNPHFGLEHSVKVPALELKLLSQKLEENG